MYESENVVLLVEDDPNDQLFITRAFKRTCPNTRVQTVNDGEEAIDYLEGRAGFEHRSSNPLPRLIITDLKMPRMGGLDLLLRLQSGPEFRHIPVVVLTSSSDQADITAAFNNGARGYMIKAVQFGDLEKLVRSIDDYWRASRVPSPPAVIA
jgi:CheY-like chemotaxis protein